MWQMMLAQGLLGAFSGYQQAVLNKGMTDAQQTINDANTYSQNLVNRTNADASNKVRTANNQFAAAQAALSNLIRSIGNQNKLESGGKAIDAITTNISRLEDQAVNGDLNARIVASEQLGAVRAAAASSGVGGTSATMLQKTMELTMARQNTTRAENREYQTYDMLMQRAGLVRNMVMSFDEGQTFAPIDYSVDIAPLVQSPILAGSFAPDVGSQALMGVVNALASSPNTYSTLANMKISEGASGSGSGNTSTGSDWFSWSNISNSIKDFFLK